MSKKVAILLATGFEEAEAIITIDILRRLNIEVTTLSCQDTLKVCSYHKINIDADALLTEKMDSLFDAIVLPGGPQGIINLAANPQVLSFIDRHDQAGKFICPICSAAARVLGGNNQLKGRQYVCSGELYQNVKDGIYVDKIIVEDGNLISGKGLGVTFDFAFNLAWRLTGDSENTNFQAEHIYYDNWRTPS